MLLRDQVRCRQWGSCDIGLRARHLPDVGYQYEKATVWPQEIYAAPLGYFPGNVDSKGQPLSIVSGYQNWQWRVYLNTGPRRSGSRHLQMSICTDHSKMLKDEWEAIMRLEVNEARAWDAYIDRTER